MFSLVFVVIIHMRSDTGLKVTFVFSVVIIPTPQIDLALWPESYKQTFFPWDEVNSCKPVSLILVLVSFCKHAIRAMLAVILKRIKSC